MAARKKRKPQKKSKALTAGQQVQPLNHRRAKFVEQYLVDANGAAAARRAGYSATSAARTAHKLLQDCDILAAIIQGQQKLREKAGIEAQHVLDEYACCGFTDITDYVSWGPQGVVLKDSATLTERQRRGVLEVKETRNTTVNKEGETHTTSQVSFRLHDKLKALDALGRHLDLFNESMKMTDNPIVILMQEIASSPYGSTIGLLEARRLRAEREGTALEAQ